MTRLRLALTAVALLLVSAVPATAQVGGRPFEFSAGAGLFKYDVRTRVQRGPAYVGSIGWRAYPWLTLEGSAAFGPSKADTFPEMDHNHSFLSADMRFNLRPAESRVVPYFLAGMGYGLSHTTGHQPERLSRGTPSLGFGLLYNIAGPRTYLRFQVTDHMFRERESKEFSNDFAATIGIQYVWRGKFRDQDYDGVRDWLDQSPDTPSGAKVLANGSPTDADGDSVFDGIDTCPATPRGCKVDRKGCPIDTDGDGVCDGIDICPDTPKGCTVDTTGCPADPDSDGVCNGLDKCADTPKGCPVNAEGCTTDADGDGICDALDQCPNTPAGTAVGPTGCPTTIGPIERALLATGVIRVSHVVFGTSKSAIESSAALDSLGLALQQLPGLRIEIGGPTDVKGKQAEKERLSLEQARAVLDYMKSKYPEINSGQFTLRGYAAPAEGVPPVKEAERLRGRRVEFKVLNQDELDVEREKRGLPKGGE